MVFTEEMVQSRLKIVLAEYNLKRAREGKNPVSIREIAKQTGLATSTITGLTTNRAQQVHFKTISVLCNYFRCPPGDLFLYTPDEDVDDSTT